MQWHRVPGKSHQHSISRLYVSVTAYRAYLMVRDSVVQYLRRGMSGYAFHDLTGFFI